jgi:hypothetical protein
MSIPRELHRRPTTYMKWLVHDLLEREHDNIPPQRCFGELAGAPVYAGSYSFEPTPVHIVSYRRTSEPLDLKPGAIRQEAFWQAEKQAV